MKDLHETVEFPYNGEKLLGIVLKHYTLPLADFYLIYSDHTIFEWHNKEEHSTIIDDVVIVACDDALTDIKLKKQHLEDITRFHKMTDSIMDGVNNMDRSLLPFVDK